MTLGPSHLRDRAPVWPAVSAGAVLWSRSGAPWAAKVVRLAAAALNGL